MANAPLLVGRQLDQVTYVTYEFRGPIEQKLEERITIGFLGKTSQSHSSNDRLAKSVQDEYVAVVRDLRAAGRRMIVSPFRQGGVIRETVVVADHLQVVRTVHRGDHHALEFQVDGHRIHHDEHDVGKAAGLFSQLTKALGFTVVETPNGQLGYKPGLVSAAGDLDIRVSIEVAGVKFRIQADDLGLDQTILEKVNSKLGLAQATEGPTSALV